MANSPYQDRIEGTAQTVGAPAVTALTYPVPAGARVQIKALVKGQDSASEDSFYQEVHAAARNSGGAAVLFGGILTPLTFQDAGAATWSATLVVSADSVQLRVTGQLAKTIDWQCALLIDEDF